MILAFVGMALAQAGPAAAASEGLSAQSRAWNAGKLEEALHYYCPRADMAWVNRRGLSTGYDEFARGMRADFPDPARMGEMTIELLDARAVSGDSALLSLRWSIDRDGKRLMGGVSTQLWAPCDGQLRIVLEHAS